jgi:hypothetical protein
MMASPVRRLVVDARQSGVVIDPQVLAVVEAFEAVAAGFAHETRPVSQTKLVAPSGHEQTITTDDVAAELDMSVQAVRKAARDRRLTGSRATGRWLFDRPAVDVFTETRRD